MQLRAAVTEKGHESVFQFLCKRTMLYVVADCDLARAKTRACSIRQKKFGARGTEVSKSQFLDIFALIYIYFTFWKLPAPPRAVLLVSVLSLSPFKGYHYV